ncbi:MAG: LCP family protein [Coriobacteriia bacterium]|nr:LCP family protein [Coriobacteriia bacterium]
MNDSPRPDMRQNASSESTARASRAAGPGDSARRVQPRTVFAVSALVVLIGIVVLFVWSSMKYSRIGDKLQTPDPVDREAVAEAVDPVEDLTEEEPMYILVLGSDARPGQTRARSDTILLARVDTANKAINMLSFPRDSRVPIEGRGLDKMTHANAFGGPALVIKTVKEYTGLPVHHYVELNFEGFVTVVDSLGGVVVNVEREINDPSGADTGGVSNVTHIPAGEQRLNAVEALTFVRSRAYPDGDFTRIRNQQKFLVAFAKEALKRENITRLPSVAEEAAENIDTDMSIPELVGLAMALRGLGDDDITGHTVPGRPTMINGVSYVALDEPAARALFEEFRDGSVAEPGS